MRKLPSLLYALCALGLLSSTTAFAEDHTVLVLSKGNHTVYDTDPFTGKIVKQVQLEGTPTDAILSWDEQSLFVSVPELGFISVVDVKTFKEVSRLSRPEFKAAANAGMIDALATTPDYKHLYISVPGGVEVFDQRLLVYKPDYQQPTKKIAITGTGAQRMLIHGPTSKLYYTFQGSNQVAVVDTNTEKLVKTIPVKGGPMDVTFVIGGEAWVACADGTIAVIDVNKDEVVKTIDTGSKGPMHIATATDIRYIAASHDDTGDVTILQPITKEVLNTVKTGLKGAVSVRFTPPNAYHAKPLSYPFTTQLYVIGQSGFVTVDLDKMAVSAPIEVGQSNGYGIIHYTFPDVFAPPREETSTRIMENDLYTFYDNAMFQYDLSPLHEHRTEMVAIIVGEGIAKVGCWEPEICKATEGKMGYSSGLSAYNTPFTYSKASIGNYTGIARGTLHLEDGASPSPREMLIMMPKNNYYRETQLKTHSAFMDMGYKEVPPTPATAARGGPLSKRAWMWDIELIPGKPVNIPKNTDYVLIFLDGGLIRQTRNGVPEIEHRLFKDYDLDSSEKTIEAISNRMRMIVVEFK